MKQVFPKNVISQEMPIYSRPTSWFFTNVTKQLKSEQGRRDHALLVLQVTRAKMCSWEGAHESKVHTAGAYPGFLTMKRWEYCHSPLDGMLVHRRVTPHLYTWAKGGKVK